jgi:hypothetical protein
MRGSSFGQPVAPAAEPLQGRAPAADLGLTVAL